MLPLIDLVRKGLKELWKWGVNPGVLRSKVHIIWGLSFRDRLETSIVPWKGTNEDPWSMSFLSFKVISPLAIVWWMWQAFSGVVERACWSGSWKSSGEGNEDTETTVARSFPTGWKIDGVIARSNREVREGFFFSFSLLGDESVFDSR